MAATTATTAATTTANATSSAFILHLYFTRSESEISRFRGEQDERLEALHLEVKQK